ncbi:MAG TPA: DUF190 domain-containing protein [Longimicrobiales bacterium]|nr:DUF190 domain-containing protein [Longimicrobiales bacterium]
MSKRFEGERTLMRIFIGESDRCLEGPHKGKPLDEALLLMLRERGFAGATVLRGIAGFGASAKVHTDRIVRLSMDLPIVVEVVETEDRIEAVRPELDRMIGGGLITLERAHVILYRPADQADSERGRHRTEGLEPGS